MTTNTWDDLAIQTVSELYKRSAVYKRRTLKILVSVCFLEDHVSDGVGTLWAQKHLKLLTADADGQSYLISQPKNDVHAVMWISFDWKVTAFKGVYTSLELRAHKQLDIDGSG